MRHKTRAQMMACPRCLHQRQRKRTPFADRDEGPGAPELWQLRLFERVTPGLQIRWTSRGVAAVGVRLGGAKHSPRPSALGHKRKEAASARRRHDNYDERTRELECRLWTLLRREDLAPRNIPSVLGYGEALARHQLAPEAPGGRNSASLLSALQRLHKALCGLNPGPCNCRTPFRTDS